MSEALEFAKTMKPRVAIKPPQVKAPLIDTSQSSPSVAVMADIINNAAAPFQAEAQPDPNKGTLGKIEFRIGQIMGVVGAPFELLDTGFALVSAPLAALMPGFPAATLMAPHLGTPHGHLHPPSLIPPSVVPVPLPSIGTVMCAGCVSVTIGGIFAARAGDVGLAPTCGSLSPAFEVYTGSSNTWIGGSRAARMGDITRHCNPASAMGKLGAIMGAVGVAAGAVSAGATASTGQDALQASMQAAQVAADAVALAMSALLGKDPGVPPALGALLLGNPTVLIGGFPMPDLLDVLGAAIKGLKKLGDATGKSPKVKKALAKVGLCNDPGEPVNSFSGVVYNDFEDYRATSGFTWERHYRSDWNRSDGPLGYGFRHFYERRLQLLRKRAVYESHDGERVSIPRDDGEAFVVGAGFTLTRLSREHYLLITDRDETLDFATQPTVPPSARLVRYRRDAIDVSLSYDDQGRLRALTELTRGRLFDTRLGYDEAGRIIEVRRGPRDGSDISISRYRYDDGCLVAWQDALGASASMRYDAARRMVQGTDRRGYSFHWHYDPQSGRCIKAYGDDGLWSIEARYEGNQSVFKEADGGEWTFKHFPDGVVSHILDPLGGVLEYVRDKDTGAIVKQITPGGTEYRWLYDARGKHYGRLDPFGHLLPPEDEDPDPPSPLGHDGPSTPQEILFGRPLAALPDSTGGLPTSIRQRLDALLASFGPSPAQAEPVRDALGQVIERAEPDGSVWRVRHDPEGNVIGEQDSSGEWAHKAYSSWNLLSSETSATGSTTRYEHSHRGKWRALVDAQGNRTEYVRDQRHRVHEIHRYGQLFRRYRYDAFDAIIEEQGADGSTLVAYETGPHGLHVAATLSSGERYDYDYDAEGQFTRASSTRHEVVQRHAGKLLELDRRDGKGVEHTFGRAQRLRQTTFFDRFVIRYDDVGASRTRITTPDGSVHALWHQQGTFVRENGNGTHEASVFDAHGHLAARACWRQSLTRHGAFWTTSYRYDARGALLSSVDSEDGPQHLEYDADRRLIAQHAHFGVSRYGYDPAGNLTTTARARTVEYEAGNLLRRADFDYFEHDERRRRSKHDRQGGPTVRYTYDSQDQLVQVRWSDREEVWLAAYDGLGRRSWREYGGRRTDFYWDGDRLAGERDPDGHLRIYVYGNQDALVPFMWLDYSGEDAAPESAEAMYLFTAPTGMPLRIEDARGNSLWRPQRVDAYGEFDKHSTSSCPTRLRFAGHFHDEHLGLFYNRFRDYDPALGRYLQPDPLGHAGGVNLFAYPSNPLAFVDLRGLVHRKAKSRENEGNQNANKRPGEQTEGPAPVAGKGSRRRAELDGMVSQARNARRSPPGTRQNNFSLESRGKSPARVTTAEADHMGRQFVGDGATEMSGGKGLVGKPFVAADGETYRRQYRSPSAKPKSPFSETGTQSNFETQRFETTTETVYPKGRPPETVTTSGWRTVSDGHVDVAD